MPSCCNFWRYTCREYYPPAGRRHERIYNTFCCHAYVLHQSDSQYAMSSEKRNKLLSVRDIVAQPSGHSRCCAQGTPLTWYRKVRVRKDDKGGEGVWAPCVFSCDTCVLFFCKRTTLLGFYNLLTRTFTVTTHTFITTKREAAWLTSETRTSSQGDVDEDMLRRCSRNN